MSKDAGENGYVLKVRLTVFKGDREEGHAFGRGIYMLLRGIRDSGSLNKTAKSMGMAYSKAWTILKECEAEFGTVFIERHGAKGSCLTEKGIEFLNRYEEMEKAAQDAAMEVFNKYF